MPVGSSACTAGTFPAWSCPNPLPPGQSYIFPGDNITYAVSVFTDKPSTSVSSSVTAGTFNSYSIKYQWALYSGGTGLGTIENGMPSNLVAAQTYIVYAEITIATNATGGASATFDFNLGTA